MQLAFECSCLIWSEQQIQLCLIAEQTCAPAPRRRGGRREHCAIPSAPDRAQPWSRLGTGAAAAADAFPGWAEALGSRYLGTLFIVSEEGVLRSLLLGVALRKHLWSSQRNAPAVQVGQAGRSHRSRCPVGVGRSRCAGAALVWLRGRGRSQAEGSAKCVWWALCGRSQ